MVSLAINIAAFLFLAWVACAVLIPLFALMIKHPAPVVFVALLVAAGFMAASAQASDTAPVLAPVDSRTCHNPKTGAVITARVCPYGWETIGF